MTDLWFFVAGKPEPKGSMHAFVIRGTNRAIVTDSNKKLKPWASLVRLKASNEMLGHEPWLDPVRVDLSFILARPESVSVASRPWPIVKPDLDKLTRGVLDALTGTIYHDDCQVVFTSTQKRYVSGDDPKTGVQVLVTRIDPNPQQETLL